MLISLNVGLVLWVAYGFLIHSLPIILPNAVTFFLSAPLLIMKLRPQDGTRTAIEQNSRAEVRQPRESRGAPSACKRPRFMSDTWTPPPTVL